MNYLDNNDPINASHGNLFIVASEASDLIFDPIHFLHDDNWGVPLPFNSSPKVGGGKIFGATFWRFLTALSSHYR